MSYWPRPAEHRAAKLAGSRKNLTVKKCCKRKFLLDMMPVTVSNLYHKLKMQAIFLSSLKIKIYKYPTVSIYLSIYMKKFTQQFFIYMNLKLC